MCVRQQNIIGLVAGMFLGIGISSAQQSELSTSQQDLALTRQLLDELTVSYGHLDYRLLETLESLSDQLIDLGSFDEAHDVLDRAAQIARISDGLYTKDQYGFLLGKVENFANRGDWLHARELLEHLDWLLTREGNRIDEDLIDALLSLCDLHLRGVAEDSRLSQGNHFRAAQRLNEIALVASRQLWGEFDTRLVPIAYRLVLQYYLQSLAVEVGGRTSSELRTYSSSGYLRSRGDSRSGYFYAGLKRLNEIRNIFANQESPNLEAIALSDMYLADWHVLFADSEAAEKAYAQSFNGLLRAGIEREEINAYSSYPVLLPAALFMMTWNDLNNEAASARDPNSESQKPSSIVLNFQQWSTNIPFAQFPIAFYRETEILGEPVQTATLSFNLTGLEKMKIWNRGRLRSVTSGAQNLKILDHSSASPEDKDALQQNVRDFRFRPKLIDGVPQTVNATLHYEMAAAN